MTELEERIAILEKEATVAKREAAAIQRAERAEEKEQAAAKQEEDLAPRVAAIVNCLTGSFSLFYLPVYICNLTIPPL